MKVIRILLIVLGAFLILDTVIVLQLSNYNLGVILPAVLGAPLVLLGILLPWTDHGILLILKWIAVVGYGLACLIFLVCGILMASAPYDSDQVEADVVIVLGAAVHGDRVTWVLSNRLDTAADYLDAHPETVCIVSGGQGHGETVTEASAMKRYLVEQRGIAEERILTEEASKSTLENFSFSKELLNTSCPADASVAFVTTDFHVFRASRVAKQAGLSAMGIAAPDVWYIRINNFLRECVGICLYGLRGQL